MAYENQKMLRRHENLHIIIYYLGVKESFYFNNIFMFQLKNQKVTSEDQILKRKRKKTDMMHPPTWELKFFFRFRILDFIQTTK